jgi:hypothetical protein
MDDEPYFSLGPDWVYKVLSPGTARVDRTSKLAIYARDDAMVRAEPFEAFELELGVLWVDGVGGIRPWRQPYSFPTCFLYRLMSAFVDASWDVTAPFDASSGSIFLASCLPSSTPH